MTAPQDAVDRTFARGVEYARALGADRTWKAYVDSGVLGLTMPASVGGNGGDFTSLVALFEGLGRGGGDAGLLFAMAGQLFSVQYPILKFGSERQQRSVLAPMIRGELRGAHAATEARSGSDVFDVGTTAVPEGDGYRLDGSKCHITSAPVADVALVLASTNRQRGLWGLTAFLVDLHLPGVWRSDNAPKMGLGSAEWGEIRFENCRVPADCRLGAEGSGRAVFDFALDLERAFILAPVLGLMGRQLEQVVAESNRRHRRGRSIGGFQSVSNRVADMSLRLELGRLAVYRAASLRDEGRSTKQLSAIVKLAVSEFFLASSLDALRNGGASGYLLGSPSEVDLRDAVGSLSYSGTSDVLRNIVARQAGLKDA